MCILYLKKTDVQQYFLNELKLNDDQKNIFIFKSLLKCWSNEGTLVFYLLSKSFVHILYFCNKKVSAYYYIAS